MANYFNTLSLRDQLHQLGQAEFMDSSEFSDGVSALKGKKIVVVGLRRSGTESRSESQRQRIGCSTHYVRK